MDGEEKKPGGTAAWPAYAGVVLRDLAGLVGAGAISYGTWKIYEPAGFIAAGVLLMSAAIAAARGA